MLPNDSLQERMSKMTQPQVKVGDSIACVDTPALLVDMEIVERNIQTLFAHFQRQGIAVRPHLKTVKSPEFGKLYLAAGANGVCVAKLGEAEVMACAGIEDILITTPLIGKTKLARLFALLRDHNDIKLVVDSPEIVDALGQAIAQYAYPHKLHVLIEVNVGQNRAGVEPGQPALELAKWIQRYPQIELLGVQGYEGHAQLIASEESRRSVNGDAMKILTSTVSLLRENGFAVPVVTTGGSGTSEFCGEFDVVTEVQPGSFIFMDTTYRPVMGHKYGLALTLAASVICRRSKNRIIIDAGFKSLSTDCGNAEPKDMPAVKYEPAGDEHGALVSEADLTLDVGDQVELYPSHIDTTVNLHDTYICHRSGIVEAVWPISARGKVM